MYYYLFQSTSIAAGLPYTVILNFMCMSLWRSVKIEYGEIDPDGPEFAVDIIDTVQKVTKHLLKTVIAIFIPWYFFAKAYGKVIN